MDWETVQPAEAFTRRVPISFARRFGVLGLASTNGQMPLAVGTDDTGKVSPEALAAADKIAVLLSMPTKIIPAATDILLRTINRAYGTQDSALDTVIEDMTGEDGAALVEALAARDDLLDDATSSPVTRLVNLILFEAVKRRASDVHIQPLERRVQVRLRVDGVLYDFVQPPHHLFEEVVSRIKVMGRMNIAEKRLAQDGRTTVRVGDKIVDLRISSLPTSYGERLVLRLLDKSARLYRLSELGMTSQDLQRFRQLLRRPHGLMLVTGPTGSGKSTTLYGALQELDSRALNILTLEDPIEYQLPGISQTQVTTKKGMTFATGLRTVLRQDPDVIMVGEIRDSETARMAIQSSLTGHLVFSTLHTNDAAGAVARLLDLGVEPYLVAGSLLGVLAQRLSRRLCIHCRRPHIPTREELAQLCLESVPAQSVVYAGGGCAECHHTGYHDRIGLFELLRVNDQMRRLIAARPQSEEIKRAAREWGMTTLHQDGMQKLLAGIISVEDLVRIAQDQEAEEELPATQTVPLS
jgi:general secretion pathway protein E